MPLPPYGQSVETLCITSSTLTLDLVYYRLYDPDGSLPKLVLKRNSFISAQDYRIGRIDTTNRINVNTVAGIAEAIAKHEHLGDTWESSMVAIYEDLERTKFLAGSKPRPQGVGATGTSQNSPLIIVFTVSILPERRAKKSGEAHCYDPCS